MPAGRFYALFFHEWFQQGDVQQQENCWRWLAGGALRIRREVPASDWEMKSGGGTSVLAFTHYGEESAGATIYREKQTGNGVEPGTMDQPEVFSAMRENTDFRLLKAV
jgi:hypothetical protein